MGVVRHGDLGIEPRPRDVVGDPRGGAHSRAGEDDGRSPPASRPPDEPRREPEGRIESLSAPPTRHAPQHDPDAEDERRQHRRQDAGGSGDHPGDPEPRAEERGGAAREEPEPRVAQEHRARAEGGGGDREGPEARGAEPRLAEAPAPHGDARGDEGGGRQRGARRGPERGGRHEDDRRRDAGFPPGQEARVRPEILTEGAEDPEREPDGEDRRGRQGRQAQARAGAAQRRVERDRGAEREREQAGARLLAREHASPRDPDDRGVVGAEPGAPRGVVARPEDPPGGGAGDRAGHRGEGAPRSHGRRRGDDEQADRRAIAEDDLGQTAEDDGEQAQSA